MSLQVSAAQFLANRHRAKSFQKPRIPLPRYIHTSQSRKSILFRDITTPEPPETNYPPPTKELLNLPKSISTADVHTMIAHFRKLGQLRESSAENLIMQVRKILVDRPVLGELHASSDSRLTIVGNLYGQFFDLLQIFDINGFPSPTNRYLFNGGYFGRGWFGTEILFTLFAFEIAQPGSIFFNASNRNYWIQDTDQKDLRKECECKYPNGDDGNNTILWEIFDVSDQFSVAHIVQNSIFVSHGGPPCVANSDRVYDLNYLRALPKAWRWRDLLRVKGDDEIEADEIKRVIEEGSSVLLDGQVAQFLKASNLKQIIRSNEGYMNGIKKIADGKILTLSSAPRGTNTRGAIIRFERESSSLAEEGKIVYFNNAFDPFYDSNLKLRPFF